MGLYLWRVVFSVGRFVKACVFLRMSFVEVSPAPRMKRVEPDPERFTGMLRCACSSCCSFCSCG